MSREELQFLPAERYPSKQLLTILHDKVNVEV